VKTRRMRLLRKKHSIPLLELGRYCDASQQRLSQIELDMGPATAHTNRLIEVAFDRLITARRRELTALVTDFQTYRKRLLDFVDKEGTI